MTTWLCLPSKRPPEEANPILRLWKERGYYTAVLRDAGDPPVTANLIVYRDRYEGYSKSVNSLCSIVMAADRDAMWLVTGGDDTSPDPNHTAEEIAKQCTEHFRGTFGVMQPTGDPFADYSIERICGSPWMGRDFCRRMNGGQGPMWPDYFHMFNDQELQEVAIKLGVLWQRRDLSHKHNHWMRNGDNMVSGQQAPAFLSRANSQDNWDQMRNLFYGRQSQGFPGHEPLAI